MRDHAQRVGHQSPSDGVGHAQHGTDRGEPEQARQPALLGAVEAPPRHADQEVGEAEGPTAVHVEPHPHERHERPRRPRVGLDHHDEDGEEHQRDQQWSRRPVARPHPEQRRGRDDPPHELLGGARQHPPEHRQQRAQHGVEHLQTVPAGQVLEPAIQDRGQPRLDDPGTTERGEGVGVGRGDAVGEDDSTRGDMGQERVVVQSLQPDDGSPEGERASDDRGDPWRTHGPDSGRQ